MPILIGSRKWSSSENSDMNLFEAQIVIVFHSMMNG